MRPLELRFKAPTPARQYELEHVSAQVRSEHLNDAEVHVQGLQPGPGERRQHEVVQEEGGASAQADGRVECQPAVQ